MSERWNKTAALVILVTVIYGLVSFILFGPTKTTVVCTALIFLAALTVRVLARD